MRRPRRREARARQLTAARHAGAGPGQPNLFRIAKSCLPGAYTLILPASKQLPKACIRDKRGAAVCKLRRTVGVRLPADPVCDAILQGLSRPLLCTSVRVQRPDEPGSQWLADPARIRDELGSAVDFVIDAGLRAGAPSTVVDLSGPMPRLLRRGKGDWCVSFAIVDPTLRPRLTRSLQRAVADRGRRGCVQQAVRG